MIKIPDGFEVIFECLAGSHLYGTNTPESDIDTRGVFIPNIRYITGFLLKVEQLEDKVNDTVYFDIRKFFRLCLDCNPNIIELLFVPESKWLKSSTTWELIVENRHLFLSKKARWTFSGYAYSQLKRIKNHRAWLLNPPQKQPERSEFGLPEHRKLVSDDQIGAFNVYLRDCLEDIVDMHPLKMQLEDMKETHDMMGLIQLKKQLTEEAMHSIHTITGLSDNIIEAVEREKRYKNAMGHWNAYLNWKKNRNPKRAELERKYGYDCKHASSLVRLITEGQELLTTGKITLPRPDAELILAVKNGAWSYDKLIEETEMMDLMFDELYKTSELPHDPNRTGADILCSTIIINKFSF